MVEPAIYHRPFLINLYSAIIGSSQSRAFHHQLIIMLLVFKKIIYKMKRGRRLYPRWCCSPHSWLFSPHKSRTSPLLLRFRNESEKGNSTYSPSFPLNCALSGLQVKVRICMYIFRIFQAESARYLPTQCTSD